MAKAGDTSPGERILAVLNALGIERAHLLARSPIDVLEVVQASPSRIGSIVIQGSAARPQDFGALAPRTLWIIGDQGETARAMANHPEATISTIEGCSDFMWGDTVSEHTDAVWQTISSHLKRFSDGATATLAGEGEVAGVSYRAAGSGPPVVLMPLGLSAHQWDALLPRLRQEYATVVLGGRHLQPVENLEARANGDYSRMALGIFDLAGASARGGVIEVGCGSGALLRRIAKRSKLRRLVGLDVNQFLLREAKALAGSERLGDRIEFKEGSAEAIPFAANEFDVAFSSTVMEEVNAEQMLSEMVRVTRPGGRVAVIVRGVDRGQWTNLDLPKGLKRKFESLSGSMSRNGCADASLTMRFHDAGLKEVRGGPAWSWVTPEDAWWKNVGTQLPAQLTTSELAAWNRALARAKKEGMPVWVARLFYCAIGTK
jgi:SAM-dependent methyltransferase